jgi:microcystin-dependent protein
MSDPFIGEIRIFAGEFAPQNWQFCDGRLVPIAENDTLFSLIGTTYGGDGQQNFALPDLRGRIPMHRGQVPGSQSHMIGEFSGTETVALSLGQLPNHTHSIGAASPGQLADPTNAYVGADRDFPIFAAAPVPQDPMAASAVLATGGSQPHENMPPFLGMSFIICLYGIYPSQN